jgi:hypothetical protein
MVSSARITHQNSKGAAMIFDDSVEINKLADLKERYPDILVRLLFTSSVTLAKEGRPFAQISWGMLDDYQEMEVARRNSEEKGQECENSHRDTETQR